MSTPTENTAPTGHHALSPSKFPAWEQCPCFEAGPTGEAAEHGAKLHEHLARHLHGKPDPFDGLAPEDRESLEWAAEQIRELCEGAASGGIEQRLTYWNTPRASRGFLELLILWHTAPTTPQS